MAIQQSVTPLGPRELAKDALAERALPWLLLTVATPIGILIFGRVTKVSPLGLSDVYLYDIGLILVAIVELTPATGETRWARQSMSVAYPLVIALAALWVIARVAPALFAPTVPFTVGITVGVIVFGIFSVIIGALGNAYAEVKRWAP